MARHDSGAIDDALFHVGSAKRLDERQLAEAKLVAEHAGASPVEVFVAGQLVERAASLHGGLAVAAAAAVYRSCSYGALLELNRKELCEQAATALRERSDSMLTLRIGSAIGRRLGWPDKRFDAVDAVAEAMTEAYPIAPPFSGTRPGASLQGPLDCGSTGKVVRYVAEVATIGEREYARRRVGRSGRSEEVLRRGREHRSRLVAREIAEAAERASAPSR